MNAARLQAHREAQARRARIDRATPALPPPTVAVPPRPEPLTPLKDGHRWSNAAVDRLTAMWHAGEKLEVIADAVGHSVQAVNKMRIKRGLPPRARIDEWTTAQIKDFRFMWSAGSSIKKIAEVVGRSEFSVKQKRKALRLPTRHKDKAKINIFIEVEQIQRLDRRAASQGMTRGRYLRRMIEKDDEAWASFAELGKQHAIVG